MLMIGMTTFWYQSCAKRFFCGKVRMDRNMKFKKENYLFERCHIFALALNEYFGYPIEFFWDTAAIIKDRIGQALIHAYVVTPNNQCLDISGIITREQIKERYKGNRPIYRRVTIAEIQGYIESGFLEKPYENEIEQLHAYIKKNKKLYQLRKYP